MSGLVEDNLKATAGQIQLTSPLGVWMQLVTRIADAGILAAGGSTPFGNSAMPVGVTGSGGISFLASRSDHVHAHGNLPGGTLHALATPLVAGFMSATDKAAFDALIAGGPYVPVTRTLTAGAGLTGGGDLSADRVFNIVAADGTIIVGADDIRVGVIADANHGNLSGGTLHAVATPLIAGFMSAADKSNLDALVAFAVPSTRTLTAGAGLTGGGDLSADRTFNVGQNADGSVVVNADDIQVAAAIQSGAALGATSVQPARTITAGAGLTGGGDLSANRTLDVGQNADGSVVVNANDVQVSAAIQAGAALGATAVQPSRQVIAGTGLTGGGSLAADRTFNIALTSTDGSVTISGADLSVAIPGNIFKIPAAVASAIKDKTFRYVAPTSAAGGTISNLAIVSNTLTGSNTPALTNADLRTASSRVNTTTSTANVLVGHNFTDPGMCRGAVATVGGFFICHRFSIVALTADAVVSIGINNAAIGGGANPSATGNRVVLGADTADTNLTIISTDNVGGSTKSATVISKANAILGSVIAGPRVMEVRMYALANNSANIHVTVLDIDNATTLFDGDISSTLPLNTTNLRPTCVLGPKSNANCQVDYIYFFGFW